MSSYNNKEKGFVYYFMSYILPAIVVIPFLLWIFGVIDISSCSCNAENDAAQYGYEKAVKQLEEDLYAPGSLKVTDVYCYESILYDNVDYVYKICFTAENKLGERVNGVKYFGCKGYGGITSYGENSSEYEKIRRTGSEIKIKKRNGCS